LSQTKDSTDKKVDGYEAEGKGEGKEEGRKTSTKGEMSSEGFG